MTDSKYFDLEYVQDCFSSSLLPNDDIDLTCYLNAYKELSKFCSLLGSVFGFVKTEIESKSEIVSNLRNKEENKEKFVSLKTMMEFEMGSGLLKKSEYVSGCRTLLRLHRGLDFIRSFLDKVSKAKNNERTSSHGMEAYESTLAKHHPWIIRQGAYIAMYLLPTRGELLKTICGDKIEDSLRVLPRMLEETNKVYQRTEMCYKTNGLHNLP